MEPYVEVLHLREDPQVPGDACVDAAARPSPGGWGSRAPGRPVCMGSGRSKADPAWGQQGWRASKARPGLLRKNSESKEGGRRMEGWSESVWALVWDPECPVEGARGKDSVVGKLPHVRGNWPSLHNTQTLGTAV